MSKVILIVDDDELLRRLSAIVLEREGHTVLLANDGSLAVESFRVERPDLVIVDVAMPGMNGFDVAHRMREIEREEGRRRTPIVVLTAYARSFFAATNEAGIDSYLTKPITPESLLAHVEKFLEENRKDKAT